MNKDEAIDLALLYTFQLSGKDYNKMKTFNSVPAFIRALEQDGYTIIASSIPKEYCDCNYEPIRGIEAGRHLPSCRYGIIEDFLEG